MAVEPGGAEDSDLQVETDEILFLHVVCRSIDPKMADRAMAALWIRHRHYLRQSCTALCNRFNLGTERADDLLAVTWTKVIDRAHQYCVEKGESLEAQVRRTRAWMNKIAENQLIDWWRNPHRANRADDGELDRGVENYSSQEFAELCAGQFQAVADSYRISLIAEAFEEVLNERERLVLMATVVHRTYSPRGSYMERGSATTLATKLSTTTPALRKCRERAWRKIAAFVKARDRAR